jgi:hypothetical protein
MFYENDESIILPLEGDWEFRLGDEKVRTIPVPSAWEAHTADKLTDGPALYRRTVTIPDSWIGKTICLEADAISFQALVRINGEKAGPPHRGMWSPFQLNITRLVQAGENRIEIEVWKPGGRFPLRETLAGFLPDVATTFGGIWQGIRLRAFAWAALSDVRVFAYGGGWVDVQGQIVSLGERRAIEALIELVDAENQTVSRTRANVAADHSFAAHLETGPIVKWTPADPQLYSVRISLNSRTSKTVEIARRVGFRDVAASEGKTWLNDQPQHFRGVLDWGWNPVRICPTPTRAELLDNFAKARALGFNLIKLCLFVPDEATFDVADETGMMLWLEMPMWLPKVTPEFRELAWREYRDLFRRLGHHPSIVVLSLGCELNSQADAEFLSELARLAREWMPNALHCDNSGSAEAYGGVLTNWSDFYDYHFYTDPHFFQSLAHHFHRPYQKHKPWIYGEFCDADTLRDFNAFETEPWWLAEKTPLDRDDFQAMRDYKARLAGAAVTDGGSSLTAIAREQATAMRKFIVEQVRSEHATGGYVITGWTDTPITTSGVVDDFGALKFSPSEWRTFNANRVLLMDRERRRQWIGGDRPAYRDPFVWWQGEAAEIHLVLSNGGDRVEGELKWRLSDSTGAALTAGLRAVEVAGGEVAEVAVISAQMPVASDRRMIELILTAELGETKNSWRLWAVPRVTLIHEGARRNTR